MRAPAAFLKTRIARRVFGLFLLCAVVPTAILATASYWMVTRELEEQARVQLDQAAKVSGTLLIARLHESARALDAIVERLRRDPGFDPASRPENARIFRSVSVGPLGRPGRAILGVASWTPAAFGPTESSHLGSDRPLLVVRPGTADPAIALIRTLTGPESADLVIAEVAPRHLWGDEGTEPLGPADTGFCIFPEGWVSPLHCSEGARALGDSTNPARAALVTGASDLFLGFEFAAPPWSLRLARPLDAFHAPIEFRRTVLLTLGLGIWLVVFASNVLLRHRLDPVSQLQEATRRVAAGDFSATVALSTRDELQELGETFNSMAARLRDQFTLLGALHEVDREALLVQSDVEVARAALLQFPRVLRVEDARIATRVPTAEDPDGTAVWRVGEDGRVEHGVYSLPRSSFSELEGRADHCQVRRMASQPALVGALEPTPDRAHLVLPLLERGTCFGAVVLTAPAGDDGFTDASVRRARQVADQAALALANRRLVQRLNAMSWGTLQALARSIDAVSPWTAGHSERVTRVGVAIGRQLGLTAELTDQLHRGGLLHDVGKIGVPAAILDKPGKLDEAEFEAIRAHPVIGARILEPIQAYEDVIPIVRHHHERFDGSGYPDRLAGRAIPYLARVLTVADVYDALVSRRPYRDGWTHEAAVEYIAGRTGMEFDPEIVAAFLELVTGPDWAEISAPSGATPVAAPAEEGRHAWTT